MDLGTWMKDKKLSDGDVYKALSALGVEITRSYITRIRNGVVNPSMGTAFAIWNYTNREVDFLQLGPNFMRSQLAGATLPPPAAAPAAKPGNARKPLAPKASKSRAAA